MTAPFSQRLLRWFDKHGRKHLPWQNPIAPYRVWLSEIMLQQTQVETVIPYFQRFVARFPDVQSLAAAPVDEVLHLWTGLGYYARARNLHRCAQILVDEHKGVFPACQDTLSTLPGIGRSTAAAITSIAFEQPTAILDGNVKRVLARHAAVAGWPGQSATADRLWQVAEARMPKKRCRDYTQAIMDLGATLCTRSKPACGQCPVADDCAALAQDAVAAYPGKKPAKAKPAKPVYLLLIQAPDGEVLLEQRPPLGIWGGLWCLPQVDRNPDDLDSTHTESEELDAYLQDYGSVRTLEHWPGWRHSFSHYHLDITPVLVQLSRKPRRLMEPGRHIWYNLRQPANLGLAAPVSRLLRQLEQHTQPAHTAKRRA